MADILAIVSDNAKKTRIMYGANLSYKVLQKYLAEVVGASLAEYDDGSQRYILTSKGEKFLTAYRTYHKEHESIEESLNHVLLQKKFLEGLCSSSVSEC